MDITVPGRIEEKMGCGGLPYYELSCNGAVAQVYLHGAHILQYQPAGQKPVLWQSEESWFEPGKAIRGGIPICWPWFGAHPTDAEQPSHGLVRQANWEPAFSRTTDDTSAIALQCPEAEKAGARLEMHVELGASLKVSLRTVNTGAKPIRLTEALHSYFSISDISSISVHGLEEERYIDSLQADAAQSVQDGPINFTKETDRIYVDTTRECVIRDSGLNRNIHISKTGSLSTVVWNPWIEKAARMPDFGNNEYTGMVCVETANCGPNIQELAPAAEHIISAEIRVTSEME